MTTYNRTATIAVTFGVSGIGGKPLYDETIAEGIRIRHLTPTAGLGVTAADTFGTAGASAATRGIVVAEAFKTVDTPLPIAKYKLTLSDYLALTNNLFTGKPVTVAESLNLALTQTIVRATVVAERLGIVDGVAGVGHFLKTLAERVNFKASLGRFFGAEIEEGIAFTDAAGRKFKAFPIVSESIGVADTLARYLVIRVVMEEGIDIGFSQVQKATYGITLEEAFQVSVGYISPGEGTMTTWVINTRNAAVSNYDQFEFNSFAKLGNRYIAASADGLYELIGDDDDGSDIIARVKSGYAKWGQSRFSGIKGCYVGMAGEGDFRLKIITGDDKEYVYAFKQADMQTTRVRMGKGLRAKFFRFELLSTGQDFDLDSIEFVPLVMQRRV